MLLFRSLGGTVENRNKRNFLTFLSAFKYKDYRPVEWSMKIYARKLTRVDKLAEIMKTLLCV